MHKFIPTNFVSSLVLCSSKTHNVQCLINMILIQAMSLHVSLSLFNKIKCPFMHALILLKGLPYSHMACLSRSSRACLLKNPGEPKITLLLQLNGSENFPGELQITLQLGSR